MTSVNRNKDAVEYEIVEFDDRSVGGYRGTAVRLLGDVPHRWRGIYQVVDGRILCSHIDAVALTGFSASNAHDDDEIADLLGLWMVEQVSPRRRSR